MLRNEPAFLEAMLIARQAGCYSCPINWHYKADEAGYILRDCGAKALIVHADLLRQIEGGVPDGCHVIVVEPSGGDARRLPPLGRAMRVPAGATEYEGWLAASPAYDGPPRKRALLAALLVRHHRPAEGREAPAARARAGRARHRDHADRARHQAGHAHRDRRAALSFGARLLRHAEPVVRRPRAGARALRRRAAARRHRDAQARPALSGADPFRAAAAAARRGEAALRPVVGAVRRQHRLALPAGREEADDRLVGAGDQRELRQQRGGLHHPAVLGRSAAPIRAPPAGRCPAPTCASSATTARCCRRSSPG